MSITSRLLAWSLSLMVIFGLIIGYFSHGIRDLVSTTDGIVNKDFEVVAITEQLVDTTLLFVENRRKYEILGRQEYHLASLEHLKSFERLLTSLPRGTGLPELEQGLEIMGLSRMDGSEAVEISLPSEEALSAWIQSVTTLRAGYLDRINNRMQRMYDRGVQAQRLGFTGFVLVTLVGLLGSLIIAYFLNRSMREFRKSISAMSLSEDFKPVRVGSYGELGELAKAYNRMGIRLKQEEEMRSRFISMLSHEIRTPLTSIRESINLVRDGVAGSSSVDQARFLEIAHKETIRLSDLLQRLMQASSLESGKIRLEPVRVKAYELFEEAVERIRPVAEAGRVDIKVTTPKTSTILHADPSHIQQVLFNLLGNAVKFSPAGSQIILGASIGSGSRDLVVCVVDQGPGIPEEEEDLVFERYYRGKNISNMTDGAGLGLNISRHIIRAHGGELWLEKNSSSGCVFCFNLPAEADQDG